VSGERTKLVSGDGKSVVMKPAIQVECSGMGDGPKWEAGDKTAKRVISKKNLIGMERRGDRRKKRHRNREVDGHTKEEKD